MKYKLLISIGIAITLLGFPSCGFLNLEPEDGVTCEKFWKTKEERFLGFVYILHSPLPLKKVLRFHIFF